MQDIQGQKIRTGEAKESTQFKQSHEIKITNKETISDDNVIYINYKDLFKDLNSENEYLLMMDK